MKLITDGEQFGFHTEPGDAELARATKDALDAGLTIARYVADVGPCEECGRRARLRDLAVETADGESLTTQAVCAGCQADKTQTVIDRQASGLEFEDA